MRNGEKLINIKETVKLQMLTAERREYDTVFMVQFMLPHNYP